MNIHETSRRQDLLVGSLVPTLVICAVVWLDQGHRIQALATIRLNPEPQPKRFVLPPDPVEVEESVDQVKTPIIAEAIAQIPDIPQPITAEHSFVQPIELPAPDTHSISTTIPNIWGPKGPAGITVFNPDMLDQRPVATVQAKPVYPYEMREKGIPGSVTVDFIVDPDGNVRNATVVRSTSPEFETSAISAVSKWKFKPGRKASHAVFTHMQVPINYTLDSSN
jgi:periplasmic protein TonB